MGKTSSLTTDLYNQLGNSTITRKGSFLLLSSVTSQPSNKPKPEALFWALSH